MVYLGVDLHRKVSHVVALDEAGNVTLSRRLLNDPAEFRRVFGELEPEPIEVAFEATYGWGWFADLLADAGVAAHMAHPLATKAIGAGRVKNDAIDARTLAHLLRTNLLPEAPIAPPEVREARRLIRMRASLVRVRADPRIRRLTPIPGIGFLTATMIVAEVGDVGRFETPNRLCSWAGLTPTERSSADHTKRGHISKQGSRWLRWAMVEAAVAAARGPSLQRFFGPIKERRGTKIARVALARRLLSLAFYALRDEAGCRAYPVLAHPSRLGVIPGHVVDEHGHGRLPTE